MPGTVKLWWHDGSTLDVRSHPTPLINEPELGFETLSVGTSAVASSPAPEEAHVAVIETPVPVRYRVLRPGDNGSADDAEAKPLQVTVQAVATIGVEPGYVLSLREEV